MSLYRQKEDVVKNMKTYVHVPHDQHLWYKNNFKHIIQFTSSSADSYNIIKTLITFIQQWLTSLVLY